MIDLAAFLTNATPDTIVHLDYVAGRPATAKAQEEFLQADDWNDPATKYVGHFVSLRKNKWGEEILTLWVHNRAQSGAYRAFNPKLGHLRAIRVENH